MRAVVLLLFVACACGAWSAHAQGFVSFDSVAERVVVGVLPVPGAQRIADAQPIARGVFVADDTGLRMTAPAPVGENTWIARGVTLASGIVRARFVVGKNVDATVLVRAQTAADGELVQALGISIERNRVLRIVRYQDRIAKPVGSESRLERALVAGSEVELVILLSGPALMVDLFDGASLKLLAHVAAHDSALSTGHVGVRVHGRQDAASFVKFLAASPQDGPTGMRDDEGAGDARFVTVGGADALPPDLRARIVEAPWLPVDGRVRVHTDPPGVERLRRLGIAMTTDVRVPWGAVEPSLRRGPLVLEATATGVRVPDGYKNVDDVERVLRAFAARFPALAALESIGKTHAGRDVWALRISDRVTEDEGEPSVLLDGAHHAGELMSTEAVLDVIQQLLEGYATDASTRALVDGLVVFCVPLVNPDGLARFIEQDRNDDRKNGAGVDLYRNYPVRWGGLGEGGSRSFPQSSRFRGPAAGSEPETRAMMALAERERFVASVDFHTNGTVILAPYTDPSLKNPPENEAWTIAEELAAGLPRQSNDKRYVVQQNLYPVDGTAQDFLRFTYGTVALLIELPVHNPQPFERGRADLLGVRPAWRRLLTRVLTGPRLSGRVVDETGRPLAAELLVDAVVPQQDEHWTARPRDGRFDRLLPRRAPATLRVRHPGFVDAYVHTERGDDAPVVLVLQRTPMAEDPTERGLSE